MKPTESSLYVHILLNFMHPTWYFHYGNAHVDLFFKELLQRKYVQRGPGSVVGIATAYGLDDPGIQSQWGRDFSAPVKTGPEAHPASCTVGIGSFLGVRCGRDVTLTPHPLLVSR